MGASESSPAPVIKDEREWTEVTCPDVPRFDANEPTQLAEGVAYLKQKGYAVLANVLSPKQVEQGHDLLWQWLENRGVSRESPSTWISHWPGDPTVGILYGNGLGQSDFLWHCRGAPLVHKVFAAIWETEDLVVSFDGANVFRPWRLQERFFEGRSRNWKTRGGWWHVDQNPVKKPGLEAVQGFVSLTKQDARTGGLTILSCRDFQQRFKDIRARNNSDFIRLPSDSVKSMLQEEGVSPMLVSCEAGDLVLWDGRVVHCNSSALDCSPTEEERVILESDQREGPWPLLRALAYVCMTPRSKALPETLERRKLAVLHGAQSTHWAHEMRATSPGEGGRELSTLTEHQRSLV